MKPQQHLSLFLLALCTALSAQLPEQKALYPEGLPGNVVVHPGEEYYVDSLVNPKSLSGENRVYIDVSEASYSIFPAPKETNKHIGLVIFPGGGLVNNWFDKEGTDLALWLSEKGISCMVVKYRTNRRDENRKFLIDYGDYKGAVYQDARTSIMLMKKLADSLDFDADQVGIAGFSAGAWLCSRMAMKYSEGNYEWKPAFIGLIYGGENVKSLKKVKKKDAIPPVFMATAADDHKLPLEKLLPYFSVIISEVPQSELHIYSKGDHGFGLAYDNGYSVELWKENFYRWILDINNTPY